VWLQVIKMVESFGSHLNIEMQQRGVEFSYLFANFDHLRPALLERMPPIPSQKSKSDEPGGIDGLELDSLVPEAPAEEAQDSNSALLLLLGGGPVIDAPMPPLQSNAIENNQDLLDLLGGLDGPSLNNFDIPKTPVNSDLKIYLYQSVVSNVLLYCRPSHYCV
jgi:AP-1 complex subunit gamma-1